MSVVPSSSMFDALSAKLTEVLGKIGSGGRLSERDVDSALREMRMALLEADVNFKVARDLVAAIRVPSGTDRGAQECLSGTAGGAHHA